MNEDAYRELREISWRRKLTPPEEAALQQYLAAHPAEQAEWLEEAALEDMLELLPAAPPVASNFTALVLEAARREDAARERERTPAWLYGRGVRSWLPKFAFATGLVGIVAIGYHTQQVRARPVDTAVRPTGAGIPSAQILHHVRIIRRPRRIEQILPSR